MKGVIVTGVLVLLLAACGQEQAAQEQNAKAQPNKAQPDKVASATLVRSTDFAQVARGWKIYQENCAECHGRQGEGAPNWRQREADGTLPAPPLNGTGHAWHHPDRVLRMVIKFGSPGGQGKMPAWQERLSDEEILDVIAWFKSRWPDELYGEWHKMNERSKEQGERG